MKNWLLSSSSGRKIAASRAAPRPIWKWSASRFAEQPDVDLLPHEALGDAHAVDRLRQRGGHPAETFLLRRGKPAQPLRKWLFTQRIGAIASTTRNSTESHQASPGPRRSSGRTG